MTYRDLRIEWENREDLRENANECLEEERKKAILHSSLPDIVEKSKNIHASFFFEPKWQNVLKILCQKLCSFPKNSAGGWADLADKLNLCNEQINAVKHGNINIQQDNAFIILLAYALNKEATVWEVLNSLNKMKRYDIIDTVSPLVINLCDQVNTNHSLSQDGGYHSQESDSNSIVHSGGSIEAPIILHSITVDADGVKTESSNVMYESLQRSQPYLPCKNESTNKSPQKVHSLAVMITHAEDGEAAAQDLATALRNSFDKKLRSVGVVILRENKRIIVDDPLMNIMECFNQVDFVIAVITRNYIDRVFPQIETDRSRRETVSNGDVSPILQPDTFYAPLIFRLMSTEYTRQQCRNARFRTVIPDDHKDLLLSNHPIMNVPFLSTWCLLKEAVESPRRSLYLKRKRSTIEQR